MLLKNHLIEVFKQASLENNSLLKDNVVFKWVHRFGIDSLNDLLIHSSTLREFHNEEENKDQIRHESLKTLETLEETNCESNYLKTSNNNKIFNTKQYSNQVDQYIKTPKLPLPNIKNLRKWINKDKKAS